MTLVQVVIGLVVAGVVAGVAVLLLKRKKLPLPKIGILRAKSSEMSSQERAALLDLARSAVTRYPELGATPPELLAEINAYFDKARPAPDRTSRLILEKMLAAGSLRHARSYWQVNEFLNYRDKVRKPKQT